MLDVHPPHESIHGWRDFLLHLLTITIGLLIALSLEGLVEWQHHRHLVHEAEASLRTEIKGNADSVKAVLSDIAAQRKNLEHDVLVLRTISSTGKMPQQDSMSISFSFHDFADVSWKTAQSTGALAYMPYGTAQEFAGIYALQEQLNVSQQLASRDAILSLAPFGNINDAVPAKEEIKIMINQIRVLEGQLLMTESIAKGLSDGYSRFLTSQSQVGR